MGDYTFIKNKNIDSKIENDLKHIVAEITKNINPTSIILTGSFGRGEGTVVNDNGKLNFLSDYEICVVSPKLKTRKICAALSKKMSRQLGAETSIAWISPRRLKYNINKNISRGYSYPSIFMYELKAGSRVLYGENLINENRIRPEEIGAWEGIKLLLNRMVESFSSLLAPNSKSHATHMWINKILLACGDNLLLKARMYHHSYEKRRETLIHSLNVNDYPFLTAENLKCIIKAYETKLNGDFEWYPGLDLSELNSLIDRTLRYFLLKEMNVVFSTYGQFPEKYLDRKENLHKFYIYNFYSLNFPLFENLVYLIRLFKWGTYPSIKIAPYLRIPFHHLIYSIIPPLYFFDLVSDKDKEDIKRYANRILLIFNESASEDIGEIKKGVLSIWFRVCFGKKA